MPGIDRRPSGSGGGLSVDYIQALGKYVASGGAFGEPTLFAPTSTIWSDAAWLEIDWGNFIPGVSHWTFGYADDGLPWVQHTIQRDATYRAAESQIQCADAANLVFADIVYNTIVKTDGSGGRLAQLVLKTDVANGFTYAISDTASTLTLIGLAGQTDPLLDLHNSAAASIFKIAPDGSVGGVTPTTTAFVIGWDGTKWIAVSLAAVYEAAGTAILKTVVNAKGDLISATADNTPSIVTAGADDTILMADSAATSGLKWVASATPSTQAIGDAASTGTADTFTRGDHKHAMPAFATNAVVLGSAAAAGSAVTLIRSDATIAAFDATSPTTQAVADAAAVGTASFAARRDHKHAWPSGASFMASLTGTNGADFSMNTHKITAVTDPTAAQDAATKNYTDAAAGGVAWTVVTKAADESVVSSTVLQNDDHLLFTAVNGGSYEIELSLVYASPGGAGTPDMKVALGEDNTIRGQVGGTVQNAGDTVATSITGTNQTTTIALGTSATKRVAVVRGSHQGAGGTFNVLWAQNTSDTNSTTVYTGSTLRYRRVV